MTVPTTDKTTFRSLAHDGKEEKIALSGPLYRLQRSLSLRCSWLLSRVAPSVQPNTVSRLNVGLALAIILSAAFTPSAPYALFALQLAALFATAVLDKIDGELARTKRLFTQAGVYYDIVYHFLYLFGFYVSVSAFVAAVSGTPAVMAIGTGWAVVMMLYGMLGKIKHHVRYKVLLEGHGAVVADPVVPKKKPVPRWQRRLGYLFFMPYEWTWLLHALFGAGAYAWPALALPVWSAYAGAISAVTLQRLLLDYPRRRLFRAEDFTRS